MKIDSEIRFDCAFNVYEMQQILHALDCAGYLANIADEDRLEAGTLNFIGMANVRDNILAELENAGIDPEAWE